jgi:hypothetical protein
MGYCLQGGQDDSQWLFEKMCKFPTKKHAWVHWAASEQPVATAKPDGEG